MEECVETFDVSDPTSELKPNESNNANHENKEPASDKNKCSEAVCDVESQTTSSPIYEDFVDFDPSNFRLTPESTISPKRDECTLNDFKSVDSYHSFTVLSVDDSDGLRNNGDASMYKLQEELVIDNNEDDNLMVVENLLIPKTEEAEMGESGANQADGSLKLFHSLSDDKNYHDVTEVIDLESSASVPEINAGNVSFDIAMNLDLTENEVENVVENKANRMDSEPGRDSLDSQRILHYLRNEKVSDVCKRLKADLKGTKDQNLDEIPYADEMSFSEKVYNYIADLKAYSTISSNDGNGSRLSSIDFKTLQTLDTLNTSGSGAQLSDFESVLEKSFRTSQVSNGPLGSSNNLTEVENIVSQADSVKEFELDDLEDDKPADEMEIEHETVPEVEMTDEPKSDSVEDAVESKPVVDEKGHEVPSESPKHSPTSSHDQLDDHSQHITDGSYESGGASTNKQVEEHYGGGNEQLNGTEFLDKYRNYAEDCDYSGAKYSKLEETSKMSNLSFEDRVTTDELVEDTLNKARPGQVRLEHHEPAQLEDNWQGLDCMPSDQGANLVYGCLKSIKVLVGENLHEYDVYKGTKKFMLDFLVQLRRVNELEKELNGEFLALEKNDYNLEATRNCYLTLMRTNNRLKTLLNYHKNVEKLQRDSINLKSDNIALMRSEILNKLNQFQVVSKLAETNEAVASVEAQLVNQYNETGFFVLPLHYDSYYNFMYVFNFNYYSHYTRRSGGPKHDRYSKELAPEMLDKLRVIASLPYKPRRTELDLELKLFMFFKSYTTSSSDQYAVSTSKYSSASGSSFDLFEANRHLGNAHFRDHGRNGRHASGASNKNCDMLSKLNLNIDPNTTIDLYTLKNDLRLVLYSPMYKDSPYYRFKYDLVVYFNNVLNSMFSSHVEELNDSMQLQELLKQVVQYTKEVNDKFVDYLRQFDELVKTSSNYHYQHLYHERPNGPSHAHTLNGENHLDLSAESMSSSRLSKEYRENIRVLKLMLTFSNDMPCLWCNIYFNFNTKHSKLAKFSHFTGISKDGKPGRDGIIGSVQFEFVHSLNKNYQNKYKDAVSQLNKAVASTDKGVSLVTQITSSLNSHHFYL